MNRHALRIIVMDVLYQYLLLDSNPEELISDNLRYNLPYRFGKKDQDEKQDIDLINVVDNQFTEKEEIAYVVNVTSQAINNYDEYKKIISERLTNWSFDRLGYLEQSILLLGLSELDLKTAPENSIKDEAVELAKHYCDDDAYKLINGVLDKK